MSVDAHYHEFRESCLKIIEHKGECHTVDCLKCPFEEQNHLPDAPFNCKHHENLLSSDLLLPACHEWLFHDPCINILTYAIKVQREVLGECCGSNREKHSAFIGRYAAIMRQILNEWVLEHDRLISKDDLIWICSQKTNHDIRKD